MWTTGRRSFALCAFPFAKGVLFAQKYGENWSYWLGLVELTR